MPSLQDIANQMNATLSQIQNQYQFVGCYRRADQG